MGSAERWCGAKSRLGDEHAGWSGRKGVGGGRQTGREQVCKALKRYEFWQEVAWAMMSMLAVSHMPSPSTPPTPFPFAPHLPAPASPSLACAHLMLALPPLHT